MNSDQSSFREMFQFPNSQSKSNKKNAKSHRNKRLQNQSGKPKKQSLWKVVRKAKNVAVFIQNLKNRISQNTSFDANNLKSNELSYLQNDSQSQSKTAFFAHDNKLVLTAEIIYVGIMLLYFWQCTYQMVLGDISDYQMINSLAITFYFIHIILQQVTQLKNQKSQLITDMNSIQQIYKKEKLIRDIISITSLILQITPLDNHNENSIFFLIIRFLSLLAYFELSDVCQKIEHVVAISVFGQTVISFFKLLFKLFVFLHGISIFLIWLVSIENYYGNQVTWLSNPNLTYNSNLQKYVLAWYWGCTILSSVGFGQITPYNNLQRFLVSLLQVISCIFFGYFVNTVGQMIKVRSQYSEKYVKQVRSLNRFLSLLTISSDLKHKLRKHYFNKNLVQSMCDPKQEKQVLNTITPNLRKSLLQQINLKILKKCSQFQKFQSETINKIAQALKRSILAPEYLLYSRNSIERKLWLVEDGIVEEFTDIFRDANLRKVTAIYDSNQPLIGWINFITPHPYKTLAKAKNFTVTHQLDQEQFIKCISQNKADFNKFNEIKQKQIQKKKMFYNKCISCGRFTHNVINCPRIHFVKKDGSKLAKFKINLDKYIREQTPKLKRALIKCNWKRMFGSGQLLKDASIFANNGSLVNQNEKSVSFVSENFRKSVMDFQMRKISLMLLKEMQNQSKQANKDMNMEEKSSPSDKVIEQPIDNLFQSVYFNQENDDYFPQFDISKVINGYHKKNDEKKKL